MKDLKKVPYQGTLIKDLKILLIKDLKNSLSRYLNKRSQKYLIKEPYRGSNKKYLIKEPYQRPKESTLSRNLIKDLKKVPYQGSKKCLIKLV